MSILNYKSGRLQKLFAGRVPLHTVDLTGDPLDVRRVGAKFGVAGLGENMVERVVQPENQQLSSVCAAVILLVQLLGYCLGMLGALKAVHRCFLKVTRLAVRVTFTNHRRQAGAFTAVGTQSTVAHCLLPLNRTVSYGLSTFSAVCSVIFLSFTARGAQVVGFKSIISTFRLGASLRLKFRLVLIFLAVSSDCFSLSYNTIIHWAHDLCSWVKWLDPFSGRNPLGGLSVFYQKNPVNTGRMEAHLVII